MTHRQQDEWVRSFANWIKRRHSQNASVVLLLVHLVNYIFDEDAEVFHGMVVNNVTHIRYQNRLLNSVFKIHQKPKYVIIIKKTLMWFDKNTWKPRKLHLNRLLSDFQSRTNFCEHRYSPTFHWLSWPPQC